MLANLPFYCVLVPVFAEVTLIRIRANGDSAAANCLKVCATVARVMTSLATVHDATHTSSHSAPAPI